MKPTRPVLRYYGGKWSLAPWILTFFPEHGVYVEPMGGAGSVLLRKEPAKIEVYNDLDGEMVNLFRVLRDEMTASRLYEALALTPYASEEFFAAYEPIAEPVERARRTIIRGLMGHGSSGANGVKKTGFRRPCGNEFSPASDWANWREQIPAFASRLSGVIIESIDALKLLDQYDAPAALFYVDPPYPVSTRGRAYEGCPRHAGVDVVYRHDMREDDEHRALAEALHKCAGMVVLSGYPCDLYDLELFPDWERMERSHFADSRLERTEVVWLNPACANALREQHHQHRLFNDPEAA